MFKKRKIFISIPIILVSVLILGGFYVWSNERRMELEVYKINTDCAQQARTWTKDNSDSLTVWSVNKSIFNVEMRSCIAEFIYRD